MIRGLECITSELTRNFDSLTAIVGEQVSVAADESEMSEPGSLDIDRNWNDPPVSRGSSEVNMLRFISFEDAIPGLKSPVGWMATKPGTARLQ